MFLLHEKPFLSVKLVSERASLRWSAPDVGEAKQAKMHTIHKPIPAIYVEKQVDLLIYSILVNSKPIQ